MGNINTVGPNEVLVISGNFKFASPIDFRDGSRAWLAKTHFLKFGFLGFWVFGFLLGFSGVFWVFDGFFWVFAGFLLGFL